MSRAPYSMHPMAERELEQAALYYDAARPGTGARFLDAFEKAMALLCAMPEAPPIIRGNIRSKGFSKTWPYRIHYRIIRGRPRVLSLAHTSRQPFYWLGRH